MERYLKKDFDVQSKHSSEAALRRWRSAVTIVKNRRRRFRDVANLHMRSEAEKKKLKIQVLICVCYFYFSIFLGPFVSWETEEHNNLVPYVWDLRILEGKNKLKPNVKRRKNIWFWMFKDLSLRGRRLQHISSLFCFFVFFLKIIFIVSSETKKTEEYSAKIWRFFNILNLFSGPFH